MDGDKIESRTPVDQIEVDPGTSIRLEVAKQGFEKVKKKVKLDPNEDLTVIFHLPEKITE